MKILLRGGPKDGQVKDEPEVDFDHEEAGCEECAREGREPRVLKKLTLQESYDMLKEFYLGTYKKTELLVDFACYDYVSDMLCSTCGQTAAENEKCGNCFAVEQGLSRYVTSANGMAFVITHLRSMLNYPARPQEFKATAAPHHVVSESVGDNQPKVYDIAELLEVHDLENTFVYELRRDGYTPVQKRWTESTQAQPLFVVLNFAEEKEEQFLSYAEAEARAQQLDEDREFKRE